MKPYWASLLIDPVDVKTLFNVPKQSTALLLYLCSTELFGKKYIFIFLSVCLRDQKRYENILSSKINVR